MYFVNRASSLELVVLLRLDKNLRVRTNVKQAKSSIDNTSVDTSITRLIVKKSKLYFKPGPHGTA